MCSSGFTTATSGLAVAMLHFGCRSTSAGVDDEFIETGYPENPGIAFRTACLSVVEREI